MMKISSIWICTLLLTVFMLVNDGISQQASYPVDTKVSTTFDRTVVPVPVPTSSPSIPPDAITKYSQYGESMS